MIDNVKDLIIRHEGTIPYVYQDSLGFWTIGVGHLVDKRRGGKLSAAVIESILLEDIDEVKLNLPAWISPNLLGAVRYAVLVDMGFNLGVDGLLQFQRTLEYVRAGKFAEASVAMGESKWAKQVGPRAARLRKMMETGEWPSN